MSALQEIVDRTEYNARVEHERTCDADPFEGCEACSDRRAAITSAREELRALRAENEALAKYARHPYDCTYFDPHPVTAERPCSCGLSALLRKDGERD